MEDISGLQEEFESYSKYFTDSSTDSFIMWTEPFTVKFKLKIQNIIKASYPINKVILARAE